MRARNSILKFVQLINILSLPRLQAVDNSSDGILNSISDIFYVLNTIFDILYAIADSIRDGRTTANFWNFGNLIFV